MKQKLQLREFVLFCDHTAELLRSGVSLKVCLDILSQDAHHSRFKGAILAFKTQLESGLPFCQALETLLPESVPLHLSDLVQPPNLVLLLGSLSDYYDQKIKTIRSLQQKLAYPLVLCLSMLGIVGLMGGVLLPLYAQFYLGMGVPLPGLLTLSLHIREGVTSETGFIIWGGFCIGIILGWPSLKVRLSAIVFPYSESDILWLISVFIKAGFSLKQSLDTIRFHPNHPLYLNYSRFYQRCIDSGQFSVPFSQIFFLRAFERERLQLGEMGGNFGSTLSQVAHSLRCLHENQLHRRLSWIQPILLCLMAGMIGGCMWMTFVPAMATLRTLH